jgi:plasmid stabilization system protein ParE
MTRVTFHPLAERELIDACRYYDAFSAGLGRSLIEEVQHGLDLLAAHPLVGAPVRRGLRRLVLRRFPYALIYRPQRDSLCVLAVMNLRRRPAYWAGR